MFKLASGNVHIFAFVEREIHTHTDNHLVGGMEIKIRISEDWKKNDKRYVWKSTRNKTAVFRDVYIHSMTFNVSMAIFFLNFSSSYYEVFNWANIYGFVISHLKGIYYTKWLHLVRLASFLAYFSRWLRCHAILIMSCIICFHLRGSKIMNR